MTRVLSALFALAVIFGGLLHPCPIAPHATAVSERCK